MALAPEGALPVIQTVAGAAVWFCDELQPPRVPLSSNSVSWMISAI
jgi:hypothetical protein